MIVVGVDPGSRDTGIAVVDVGPTIAYTVPTLLASFTVHRPDDGSDLLEVPSGYLQDVNAAILSALRPGGHPVSSRLAELIPGRPPAELIAVERVTRPSWQVRRGSTSGRGGAAADPTGIMATAIVLGAILGRAWTVPLVAVAPKGNGKLLPLTAYPEPLATNGKGHDKRRHERAAYDVACLGPGTSRVAAATGGGVYA